MEVRIMLALWAITHVSAQCGDNPEAASFILSTHAHAPETAYQSYRDVTLIDCTQKCRQSVHCKSLSYSKNTNGSECQLISISASKTTPSKTQQVFNEATYYFEKVCLKGACERLFVAESIQGMALESYDDTTINDSSRLSCLESCLISKEIICRSIEFDAETRICRLSRHDRFDRKANFKKSSIAMEYMDVSCSYKPVGDRPSSAEIVLLGNVEHPYTLVEYYDISAGECGELCLKNTMFPCRSFLSGRVDGQLYCGLTHQDKESLLQNPGHLHASRSLHYYEIARSVDVCDTDDLNFELVTGMVLNVTPYRVSSDLSPTQCMQECKRDRRCRSLSIDYRKGACQYNAEQVAQSVDPKLEKNANFNYFEKNCLPAGSECRRDWAFERIRRKELVGIDPDKVSVDAHTKEECQAACLAHREFACRSAEFNYELSECRISPYNRFSSNEKGVNLAHSKLIVDYFENNCIIETRGFCNTRLLKKVKLSLSERVVPGQSMNDCQQQCYENEAFICRSVTFDHRFRTCALSHHTRKSAPPESISRSDNTEFLEISTCFHVTVECEPDLILARVQTNALFKGKVYAKGHPLTCSTDVSHSLEFTLPIPLTGTDCGTVTEEEGKFSNVVVIQSNDHVVTALDKAIGVHCSYDVGNKTEETQINITDPNASDKTRGSPSLPDLSLHIVDMKGKERETVSLGELLRVQVRMSDEDTYGIFVRNLVAKDGAGGNNLTLIDNTGCPVEVKMMREVRTIEPQSKSLEGYLEAFTFTGSSILELEAEVETCLDNCKPVLCQIPTGRRDDDTETVSSFGRKKRSLDEKDVLSSVRLSKSVSISAQDFEAPQSLLTNSFPVTAPPFTGNRIFPEFQANGQSFCFDPLLFAFAVGGFFCIEICGLSACLIGACRWSRNRNANTTSNKKKQLSIYYENSISDGSELTTN